MPGDAPTTGVRPGQVFSGLKFWVPRQIPNRSGLINKLTWNGGVHVALEKHADYCLVDPAAKKMPTGYTCYHYDFVVHSLDKHELQDPEDYLAQLPACADRPVGDPSLGRKTTRTAFTPQDDQILFNWIRPLVENGGKVAGNEIYRQLAGKYPHHPHQSWRSRFLDHVQYNKTLTVTEQIDPFEEVRRARAEREEQTSPKRRRLNVSPRDRLAESSVTRPSVTQRTSGAAPQPPQRSQLRRVQLDGLHSEPTKEPMPQQAHQDEKELTETTRHDIDTSEFEVQINQRDSQRQSLLQSKSFTAKRGTKAFNLQEAQRLYKAVPEIHTTSPEKLKSCWHDVAEAWDGHSAEEWEHFYEDAIKPEYMRRNRLKNMAELDKHVYDLLANEDGGREATPEMKREHTPDPRSPAERQRIREQERARAEMEEVMSDTSHDTHPQLAAADLEIPLDQRQPSPALASPSPLAQRDVVHANEGRKRASQQTNSTQSESQTQNESQAPGLSPKKRLFGQILNIAQTSSQSGMQHELRTTDVSVASPWRPSAVSQITNQTGVTSSTSSLPAAQKPPESYQLPAKSVSTSQESAQYDTAKQRHTTTTGSLETSMTSIEKRARPVKHSLPTRGSSPVVDLLSDSESDDVLRSQGAMSDTGSEYMAFDTAPEKSQAWDTAPAQADEAVEVDANEQESEQASCEIVKTRSPSADTKTKSERVLTALPRSMPSNELEEEQSEEDIENDTDAYSMRHEEAADDNMVRGRVETQALFNRLENELSEFDLPPPEGGWEALGLDELHDEDPDEPITTVELPDGHSLKHQVSPAPSQTTLSSALEDIHNNRVLVPQTHKIHEISSDDETESTTEDEDELSAQPQRTTTSVQPRSASVKSERTTSSHTTNTTTASSDSMTSNGYPSIHMIQEWMERHREQYDKLSPFVFKRLASTATSATILNLQAASAVLRHLVEAYSSGETRREEEHYRWRQHVKSQPMPFRAKTRLSDTEAKALLPDDMYGVWTMDDDEDLLSRTSASIGRVEQKHTKRIVRKRARFLQFRYGLVGNADGSAGPSTSTTPMVGKAKRKR